jgi:hypothetical protein
MIGYRYPRLAALYEKQRKGIKEYIAFMVKADVMYEQKKPKY